MSNNYDDIINMPHHESKVYKRMPIINRAAQFAPFAALTGYEDAIEETGRLTTERKEIDEYVKAEINDKLNCLSHAEHPKRKVTITYFIPDSKKEGGEYVARTGTINKIDMERKIIILDGKEIIGVSDIIAIDGVELFE